MTLADPPRGRTSPALHEAAATVSGWGGGAGTPVSVLRPSEPDALEAWVRGLGGAGAGPGAEVIARGMGRSYGDAAQLAGGRVIDMTGLRDFALDPDRGTVTAEAGATLADLLDALVPQGWILPVVPGTQHVTVGGAIAGDIHGKNHGTTGTFGTHVEAIGLLTAAGEVLELEPGAPDQLFEATLGGMGLTGVILWARIRLRAVDGAMVSVDLDRAEDLDHALALLSGPGGPYRVAWLDLLGRRAGRGIVTRAEHADTPASARADAPAAGRAATAPGRAATVRARATIPPWWPGGLLRPATVASFNELRFRLSPRRARGRLERFGAHMFPLDALGAWPRLYGRHGFLQYQFVVPLGGERVLERVIACLRTAHVPCFLAVLKDFGAANRAPLSFPIQGWTLALDLPRAALGLEQALRRCDEMVAEAGGRVYLSKDARMRADVVEAMYPELPTWRAIRDRIDPDRLWRSDLALRTGLVPR